MPTSMGFPTCRPPTSLSHLHTPRIPEQGKSATALGAAPARPLLPPPLPAATSPARSVSVSQPVQETGLPSQCVHSTAATSASTSTQLPARWFHSGCHCCSIPTPLRSAAVATHLEPAYSGLLPSDSLDMNQRKSTESPATTEKYPTIATHRGQPGQSAASGSNTNTQSCISHPPKREPAADW